MAEHFLPRVTGADQPFASAFLSEASSSTPARLVAGHNTYSASGDARQINGTILSNFTGPIEKVEVYPIAAPEDNEKRDYLRILRWLDPPNQSKIHNGAIESRQAGTGLWFLDGSDFEGWLNNPTSMLWLYGGVGCGKTVLCSSIIETVKGIYRHNEDVRLGYFYCSFRESLAQDLGSLLRVWIGQLCKPGEVPHPLRALYSKCHETYPPEIPNNNELSITLIDILSRSTIDPIGKPEPSGPTIYLIVDAIDEIPLVEREKVFQLFKKLRNMRMQHIHVLATSRDQSDIKEAMQSWQRIVIDKAAVSSDISHFISSVIESHGPLCRQAADTKEAILATLVNRADGMFLYASLQLNMLKRLRLTSSGVIRQVLEKLPKDLNDTYARILSGLDEETLPQASSALKWLVASSRPLFIEELAEACGIRLDEDPILDDANRLEPRQLYQMLPDLIKIQPPLPDDGAVADRIHTVNLAHFSVSNFLTRSELSEPDVSSFRFQVKEAEELVAMSCLKYLYYFNRLELRYERFPIREYAWYNWEKHIHVQGYVPRESAFLRRKAVKFYQALGKREPQWGLTIHRLDAFDYAIKHATACFRTGQHRRKSIFHWKRSLMETLNVPYFYPNFDEFELGSDRNNIAYSPLDYSQKQIRILTILPSLDPYTEVRCRMTPVNLDEAHDYIALSYVWGNVELTGDVHVNGAVLRVTHNLLSVLQNLRCHQESKLPHLWVDAICMNQTDISERGHQVSLMGSIYRRAREVVIALGDEHEYDEIGIKYLEQLASLSSSACDNQPSKQSYSRFKSLIKETQQNDGWAAIVDVFDRPWWQRAWTIQEVVLASNATIVIGNNSLNFTVVDQVVSCTESIEEILLELEAAQSLETNPGWRSAMAMARTRRDFQSGQNFTLPVLLYRFSWQLCVDPRDKIYSLLGLLSAESPKIQPDYSQTTYRTFLDVALYTIWTYQNLDILSFYSSFDSVLARKTLQSWVPELTCRVDVVPLTLGIFNSQNSLDLFTAGGTISARSITWHNNLLGVRGIRIDYIEKTFSVDEVWSKLSTESSDPVPEFSQKSIGQSVTEVIWRTMLADQWHQGHRLKREHFRQSTIPPRTREEERVLLKEPGLKKRMRFLRGRCMFVTRRGYLGLGLASLARPGDSVVTLEGGSVPYLLREDPLPLSTDSEIVVHEFAGECYVHGIMNGEAPAALELEEESGMCRPEEFWVR